MSALALFPAEPYAAPEPDPGELSADQRRTRRQRAGIKAGVHPLAYVDRRVQMHPDADLDASPGDGGRLPLRCGTCIWRTLVQNNDRTYPKCLHPRGAVPGRAPVTSSCSAASDCRAWWPACTEYEPGGGRLVLGAPSVAERAPW